MYTLRFHFFVFTIMDVCGVYSVELMITCWNFSAFDRPLFEEVLSKLPAVKGYEVQV